MGAMIPGLRSCWRGRDSLWNRQMPSNLAAENIYRTGCTAAGPVLQKVELHARKRTFVPGGQRPQYRREFK
jgi:hypothetical protein